MATTLFELLGKIAIDNKDANKALQETSGHGEKTASKLGGAFGKIGKGALAVGKVVGAGMLAAGTAVGGLLVKAVSAAGEREQNMGGSEAVFKGFATQVQSTAKEAFATMGLATSDYLATANKMGALFQGAGFSVKESMTLSADAMQRAADVASIMGIDTSAAMEAIAGAAKGNFTMMDNLGVAMNDTTLQAYALEKGIDKTTQQMTNQEKIGLAMEMFMEKTAYAAGNYAKENETLAGSLSTAKAALTNFLDGSGDVEGLVSSLSNVANVVVKNVSEIAPRLIEGLSGVIQQVVPMISPLLQQILPVLVEGATSLINGLLGALPSVLCMLINDTLPQLLSAVEQLLNSVILALPSLVQMLVSGIVSLLPILVSALVRVVVNLASNFMSILQPILDILPELLVMIAEVLMSNLPILIEGLLQLIVALCAAIPPLMETLIALAPQLVMMVLEGILAALPSILPLLLDAILGLFSALWAMFSAQWKLPFEVWTTVFAPVIEKIGQLWNTVVSYVSGAWNTLKSVVTTAVNLIKSIISTGFTAAKDKVSSIFDGIRQKISDAIDKAKNIVKSGLDAIKGFFSNLKLKFPDIKLPHFKISGKFSLDPPSVPKLSIDWYAKAMRNAMLLNSPTIFGYSPATGSALGASEAGEEVVAGSGTLMGMIRSAVQAENGQTTALLERIADMLAEFCPNALAGMNQQLVLDTGVLVGQTASAMDVELGRLAMKKVRGR